MCEDRMWLCAFLRSGVIFNLLLYNCVTRNRKRGIQAAHNNQIHIFNIYDKETQTYMYQYTQSMWIYFCNRPLPQLTQYTSINIISLCVINKQSETSSYFFVVSLLIKQSIQWLHISLRTRVLIQNQLQRIL